MREIQREKFRIEGRLGDAGREEEMWKSRRDSERKKRKKEIEKVSE